jgi:hypothetical protein
MDIVGLFCEDIREEKSGQITVVGLLPDNLNIAAPSKFPVGQEHRDKPRPVIPKLGLYVRVNLLRDETPKPMKIKLILHDKSEIALGEISAEIIATAKNQAAENGLPIAGIYSHAAIAGFQPTGSGQILAVVEEGPHRHVCGVLNLIILNAAV